MCQPRQREDLPFLCFREQLFWARFMKLKKLIKAARKTKRKYGNIKVHILVGPTIYPVTGHGIGTINGGSPRFAITSEIE